jgi:hypothetical protein
MRLKIGVLFILIVLAGTSLARAKRIPLVPLFLKNPIMMNGAEVPGGSYTLSVESQGSAVQVTLWRGGQFVAAARGNWVKSGAPFTEDAFLVRVNSDGTRSLVEIRLGGTARAIVLERPDSAMKVSTK